MLHAHTEGESITMERFFPWLYDLVMTRAERLAIGPWRRAVVERASGLVLEIASGTGLDFAYYPAGTTIIATEVDERMLALARARAAESSATVLLVVADAQVLPLRAGVFDSAVVGLAMCTIPSPSRALGELQRVLRDNGSLLMLEHVRSTSALVGRLQDWATPLWKRVAGGCRLNERTVERIAAAGFRLDSVEAHRPEYVVTIVARKRARGIHQAVLPGK
ncbi:class I SAM-dependent methyltransferase [soil metagenome]